VLKLNIDKSIKCPKCSGEYFNVKREATYLYTYKLESPSNKERNDNEEALPFLFDNRERIDGKEYLECEKCGAQYPCELDQISSKIQFTILQKAIRSDSTRTPQFLG
jgi:DNA-directed RNA polymerase subunit RPC12/RpoP